MLSGYDGNMNEFHIIQLSSSLQVISGLVHSLLMDKDVSGHLNIQLAAFISI